MKFIIIGAGELGRMIAATLCKRNHDVVLIDSSGENLNGITDKLDVMVVEGSCASISTLKRAGVENADALIAVSGDEASNVLACRIASLLGVKKTICRLYESDCFSEEDGITVEMFGIWKAFSTPSAVSIRAIKPVSEPSSVIKSSTLHTSSAVSVLGRRIRSGL